MNKQDLKQLKRQYQDTSIPKELGFIVRKTLQENGGTTMKDKRSHKGVKIAAASVTTAFVVITAGASISPVFVAIMGDVPIVGSLVKALTFREHTVDDDTYHANIKTLAVGGLENNKPLEDSLNQRYIEENKKLYEQFEAEVVELKKNGGGYLGVDSGHEVKCDDDAIPPIGRYVVNTVGSSSTTTRYDTIDRKDQVFTTLSSLFKDERYVEVIGKNIRQQMIDQNKADPDKTYWAEGIDAGEGTEPFQSISAEQNFCINIDRELVIPFGKCEVAPGYMDVVGFVVPTNLIRDLLAGDGYIC